MVAWGLIHRMLVYSGTKSLLCFPRLDAGLLICANHPDALFEQGSGLFIHLEHRTGTQKERFSILDMLPAMIAPGTDLFGCKPAANGAG